MKCLIELPLEGNDSILVEVEELEGSSLEPIARPGEIIQAAFTFDEALSKLKPITESVVKRLHGLSNPPDELGVEFAFKLSAKAGIVIASTDTEGNFKVTLTWKRDKQPKQP
jgi:hypothetical protein